MDRKDQPKGIWLPPTHSIWRECTRYSTARRTLQGGGREVGEGRVGHRGWWVQQRRQREAGGQRMQAGSGCSGRQSRINRGREQFSTAAGSSRSGPQRWIAVRQHANICAHHIAAEQAVAVAHQDASCQLAARPTSLPLQQRLRGHKPYPAHQPAPAEHARIGAAAHRTSGGVARSAAPSSRPGNWRKELPDCSLLRSKLSPAR